MSDFSTPPIFDGHVDVLSNLAQFHASDPAQIFERGYKAHIDLPKAKKGGFGGGLFALYVPSHEAPMDQLAQTPGNASLNLPLPPPVDQRVALPVIMTQMALLRKLEHGGLLKICTNVGEIDQCLKSGIIAAVLHMEGAEAIDADFDTLEVFHAAGLRSIGPVWSRPNIFGHGVPFAFPSTGDTGLGLTETGKELIKQCNRLNIMIDLSHLNEKGFWDVVKISKAPLVATHSNSYELCKSSRNLSACQLKAIAESNGMVGLNFAVGFLRADGQWDTDTGLDILLDHLDYLITHLGADRVGLGTDLDGAPIPDAIGDAAGLTVLRQALKAHGINDALMKKICHENWLGVLKRTWGE